jgi:drug/metabolite transporter (DMT)-like permease
MSQTRRTDHALAPHVALILVQLIFGTWPILGKVALRTLSSSGLVSVRIIGAAIAFSLLKRNVGSLFRLPTRDILHLVLCSLLGVVLNQFLFVNGLARTTVTNATLLGTAIPVFTLTVSILIGQDRLSLRRCIGVLLAAAGVIYLVDPFKADFAATNNLGNLLIITNCFFYGAYIAISQDLFKRYGALNVITWIFLIGAVFTIIPAIFTVGDGQFQNVSWQLWLILIYTVMVPTVGAYYLNAWALIRVTPTMVATYIYLQPLIAFALARVLLGERLSWRTVIASALIFAGVYVVTRRGRSRAAQEVSERPDALAH